MFQVLNSAFRRVFGWGLHVLSGKHYGRFRRLGSGRRLSDELHENLKELVEAFQYVSGHFGEFQMVAERF